ncbi:hypothetical protein ACIA49_12650 [Kribbella sp. NPDC051587]|uniref:hypothetical protein n=1 Tax=Kribbella sp. NPDC051587 TaxID=3364119 RepID=UPI00378F32B0
MPRRPALGPATAALCALLALTACQSSPEAGHPNTAPPSVSPTPTAPSTPAWTPEEQTAITAAKARYAAITAAVDLAYGRPAELSRPALEKAGAGSEFIISVIDGARTLARSGWYQTGSTRIASTQITSVKLDGEQPEVNLANCLDTSKLVLRFQKDGKPVPVGPGNGNRHKFTSRLVYAPPAPGGKKIWFLVTDKAAGQC